MSSSRGSTKRGRGGDSSSEGEASDSDVDVCSICLQPCDADDAQKFMTIRGEGMRSKPGKGCMELACKHRFHVQCIFKWVFDGSKKFCDIRCPNGRCAVYPTDLAEICTRHEEASWIALPKELVNYELERAKETFCKVTNDVEFKDENGETLFNTYEPNTHWFGDDMTWRWGHPSKGNRHRIDVPRVQVPLTVHNRDRVRRLMTNLYASWQQEEEDWQDCDDSSTSTKLRALFPSIVVALNVSHNVWKMSFCMRFDDSSDEVVDINDDCCEMFHLEDEDLIVGPVCSSYSKSADFRHVFDPPEEPSPIELSIRRSKKTGEHYFVEIAPDKKDEELLKFWAEKHLVSVVLYENYDVTKRQWFVVKDGTWYKFDSKMLSTLMSERWKWQREERRRNLKISDILAESVNVVLHRLSQ